MTRTNQAGRAAASALVPVRLFTLAAAAPPKTATASGRPVRAAARFGFGVAVVLLVAGTLLAAITRRRQQPGASSRPPGTLLAAITRRRQQPGASSRPPGR